MFAENLGRQEHMPAAFSVLADMTWVALQKKNLLDSNSNIGGGFGLGEALIFVSANQ